MMPSPLERRTAPWYLLARLTSSWQPWCCSLHRPWCGLRWHRKVRPLPSGITMEMGNLQRETSQTCVATATATLGQERPMRPTGRQPPSARSRSSSPTPRARVEGVGILPEQQSDRNGDEPNPTVRLELHSSRLRNGRGGSLSDEATLTSLGTLGAAMSSGRSQPFPLMSPTEQLSPIRRRLHPVIAPAQQTAGSGKRWR